MPDVFTIYSCGTAFNRQRLDELTANLASRTNGVENRDWMVNDGPGSGAVDPRSGRAPKDARPVSAQERALEAKARTPGRPAGDINPAFVTQVAGIVTGRGWEENVAHSLDVIRALARGGNRPRVVNLLGWSRGGITCHMIAHALAQDPQLDSIITNVFALDPVAGPGHTDDWDKGTIPATVNEYAAVLMEDERRFMMKPSVVKPNGAGGSRHLIYPMPGAHDTGVMIHKGAVGEVIQHLAHGFLTRHGTSLRSQIRLMPEKLCELYAIIRITLGTYRESHGGILQILGIHKRSGDIPNPEKSHLFINHHHQTMFKAAYPAIANVFFAKSLVDYKAQIARLENRWPATHKWLTEVGGLG